MERSFTFEPNHIYHIYNRGVEKRTIFHDDNDKLRFQQLLYLANGDRSFVFKRIRGEPLERDRGTPTTSLLSYSLMTNHFHIIALEREQGSISSFMGKLSTAYSMYFNTKNERTGTLLCRPFRAKHVDNDDYFRWLVSYVHLNPLDLIEPRWKEKRALEVRKATDFLTSYRFSSYPDYFGPPRPESKILDIPSLPIETAGLERFEDMLKEFKDPFERPDLEIW